MISKSGYGGCMSRRKKEPSTEPGAVSIEKLGERRGTSSADWEGTANKVGGKPRDHVLETQ